MPERSTTADVEGPEWSARAAEWAALCAPAAAPAMARLVERTAVGPGTRLLDVGCGSGELLALAAARGAAVSGLDAAEGMIAIARERVPGADLRVGAMERLPWPNGRFDVVIALNALQFGADVAGALGEAARVARPGGLVGVANWGPMADRELFAVLRPLAALVPSEDDEDEAGPPPPAVAEPGVLEGLARGAGLEVVDAGDVEVPFAAPDLAALERAILDGAGLRRVAASATEDAVRHTLVRTAAPYRRPDGSYLFRNRFRFIVARA
jgi:SAM-dependent methyltransferase